jgi:hypothetical protein
MDRGYRRTATVFLVLFVLFVELAMFLYIFSAKPIDIIGAAVSAVFFAGVAYYVYLQDPVVKARRCFPFHTEEVRETGMTDLEMAKEYLVHMDSLYRKLPGYAFYTVPEDMEMVERCMELFRMLSEGLKYHYRYPEFPSLFLGTYEIFKDDKNYGCILDFFHIWKKNYPDNEVRRYMADLSEMMDRRLAFYEKKKVSLKNDCPSEKASEKNT